MLRRAQRCVAAPLSPCRRANHISSCSSRDLRAHAHRTVTRVWSMSMTCTGACLGERGLVAAGGRHSEAAAARVLPDIWQHMFTCTSHIISCSFICEVARKSLLLHCRHVLVRCMGLCPVYNIYVRNLTEIPTLIMRSLRRSCSGARRILRIHVYRHYAMYIFVACFCACRSLMNAIL